jgi:hypothetical protein
MPDPRRSWTDLLTFRHGYDLLFVVSVGIGLPWLLQPASRTKVASYQVINQSLDFLPFHPMRLLGGILIVLGALTWIYCRKFKDIGGYWVFVLSLFWFGMVGATWISAFEHQGGFSSPFFCFAIAMGAVQYLRTYAAVLIAHEQELRRRAATLEKVRTLKRQTDVLTSTAPGDTEGC